MNKQNESEEEKKAQREMQSGEIKERLNLIKNKILVMSGKGGVGKSSVAAHLAVGLARRGYQIGLMDVDLHGPSIPRMLGLKGSLRPGMQGGKMMPVQYLENMGVMSIEVIMDDKDSATIWRGPLKSNIIRQFISDIEWMDLDFLIIDSPPGTGDEPLTVAHTVPDAKAVIVTTPQEISLADVRKSIRFCRQVNMEILGIVENMSGLICPKCKKEIDLFNRHGGELTAEREGLNLLGTLPIEPEVVNSGDMGTMSIFQDEELPFTKAFGAILDKIEVLTGQGGSSSQGVKDSSAS